jgi:hypothetical protein
MKLCPRCKEREVYVLSSGKPIVYCRECNKFHKKEYYQKNKLKILEKMREYSQKYYIKNRESILNKAKEDRIKYGYAYEKTEARRRYRRILKRTRKMYPLEGHLCDFCDENESATEHHHFTNPPEVHKFFYVCRKHHREEDKLMKKDRESYLKTITFKLPLFTLNSEQMGLLEKKVEDTYRPPVENKTQTQNYKQLSFDFYQTDLNK